MLHWIADRWGIASVEQLRMSVEPADLLNWYAYFALQHEDTDGLQTPEEWAQQIVR